jgi:ABC-type iron transport system FetAB ATPase subunit
MNALIISELVCKDRGPYSLQIGPGRVAGLQGASGSGKTLLLRAIADLDEHGGEVMLGDIRCEDIPAPQWRRQVGLLQAESFWWHDRVGDHFFVSLSQFRSYLLELGFEESVLSWQVARLSTGEKQRLAIVRLLQNRPRALLLDEPTASLDAANIERTENLLLAYCRRQQVPMLWVSHDPGQLRRVADMVFELDDFGHLQPLPEVPHGR